MLSEYCRAIEAHLCRKNDGHLIRIAGPSFEIVAAWATEGIPLKVALAGMDRTFERYYRKGPRRRPVKIDFCDADVRDVFDEWRRATGATAGSAADVADAPAQVAEPALTRRKGPSLPEHLERVLLRLSSLRATGALGESSDPLVDRVSAELDVARSRSAGLRGDDRRAVVERLAVIDTELLAQAAHAMDSRELEALRTEAAADLTPFRATMTPEAYAETLERATLRLLRERAGLPVIAFT